MLLLIKRSEDYIFEIRNAAWNAIFNVIITLKRQTQLCFSGKEFPLEKKLLLLAIIFYVTFDKMICFILEGSSLPFALQVACNHTSLDAGRSKSHIVNHRNINTEINRITHTLWGM